MDKSELISFIKSDSIDNLIRASSVKTREDIETLKKEGYDIGFTYDELKKVFSPMIADKLCYNNGFSKTFYYDNENFVLFKVNLVGKQCLDTFEKLNMDIMKSAAFLESEVKSGEYIPNLLALNDRMRMQMLNLLVENDRLSKPYETFINFYQTSDYGCSELSVENVRKIMSSKTESQISATAEKTKNFPSKVTVYRGEGDRSSSLSETVSWTTDINVANFFAARLVGNGAKIHIAEVDKEDIAEYFDYENECIIYPESINLKDSIELHGIGYFKENLPNVSLKYLTYRDYLTDRLDFQIDDKEHGRLHSARVLLNTLFIANELGLAQEDIDKLCLASVLHDVGRNNNIEDTLHGEKSAKIYRELSNENADLFPYDETVEKLIKYHCLSDNVGKADMDSYEQKLFDIIKDADALDRVRFGIRDLDINQLRTDIAKSLTMIACMSVDELSLPEQNFEQDINMT